jgi:integrase
MEMLPGVSFANGFANGRVSHGVVDVVLSRMHLETQQALFRRWTTNPDVHPYEALIGLLCLLHALRRSETVTIRVDDITEGSLALRSRRGDLSLDPATQTAIDVAVAHRRSLGTHNPHLFVSSFNVASSRPVGGDYITQIVMSGSGQSPRTLRATRLAALVDDLDAISVGNAVGPDPKNALYYLGDSQNPIIYTALE